MKMELPTHINHLGKYTNFEVIILRKLLGYCRNPFLIYWVSNDGQLYCLLCTHNMRFHEFWLKIENVFFHRNHPNSSNNRLRTASLSTSDEGIVMDYRDDTPRKRRVSTHSDIFSSSFFGLNFFSLSREGSQVNFAQNGVYPVMKIHFKYVSSKHVVLHYAIQNSGPIIATENFTFEEKFLKVLLFLMLTHKRIHFWRYVEN